MPWYKGNLHMHSFWSDGAEFPETVAAWFKDRGYHFIAFTEHDRHQVGEQWISDDPDASNASARLAAAGGIDIYRERWGGGAEVRATGNYREARLKTMAEIRDLLEEDGRFMIMSGEEITVTWQGGTHWINAFNLPRPVTGQTIAGSSAASMQHTVKLVNEIAAGRTAIASLDHPNFDWNARAKDIAPGFKSEKQHPHRESASVGDEVRS